MENKTTVQIPDLAGENWLQVTFNEKDMAQLDRIESMLEMLIDDQDRRILTKGLTKNI